MCYYFHCTPEEALRMPLPRFFYLMDKLVDLVKADHRGGM